MMYQPNHAYHRASATATSSRPLPPVPLPQAPTPLATVPPTPTPSPVHLVVPTSLKPLPPTVQAVVRAGIDALTPHTTSFRTVVRPRAIIVAFAVPSSVVLRARHVHAVERHTRPGAAWIQWTEKGLDLCVRVPKQKKKQQQRSLPAARGTGGKVEEVPVMFNPRPLKRQRSISENGN